MRTEIDVLAAEAAEAWDWLEGTVSDVTPEQANWWPPGTANSIGTTYLHIVINADVELGRLVFDTVPIIESTWNGDVGQGAPYVAEQFDHWHRDIAVDWQRLHRYGRDVHGAVIDWFAQLRDGHLERPVDMTRSDLGMWQGRDLLTLHGFNHVRIHGGEIAVLKGLQGGTGWPQTEGFASPAPFRPSA